MSSESETRRLVVLAAAIGFIGVAAGAFGAHALADRVPAARLATFETGARYALYHALALLGIAALTRWWPEPHRMLRWSGYLMAAGVVLFSGSLFMLVLTDTPWLGAVTPLGGVCFLLGWAVLGTTAWHQQKASGSAGLPEA